MVQRRTRLAELGKAAKAIGSEKQDEVPRRSRFEGRMASLDSMINSDHREVSQVLIDPKRCRMWRRHNRLYDRLDEQNCSDLIERIRAEGQKVPALVRRLPEGDDHDFEVIAGARRHFAVSYLRETEGRDDIFYLVEPRILDDKDAFLLSDLENRSRKDISDFERALDYQSALDEFYASNVSRMAEEIGMNRSSLKHYIALASLPAQVVDAYGDLHQLPVRHGSALLPKLKRETEGPRILEEAARIVDLQRDAFRTSGEYALNGQAVFKALEAAAIGPKPAGQSGSGSSTTIEDPSGNTLVVSRRGRKYLDLRIPIERLEDKKAVLAALKKLL